MLKLPIKRVVPPKPVVIPSLSVTSAGKTVCCQRIQTIQIPGFNVATSANDAKAKPGRCIIGLDPSLSNFGYAEITEGLEILRCESVPSKKLRDEERLEFLIKEIVEERIKPRKYMWPEGVIVVREDYCFGSADSSVTKLAELGGILRWELHKAKIPVHLIAIGSWKKIALGKGNIEKEQIPVEIHRLYGVDTKGSQDAADACGVAVAALAVIHRKTIKGLSEKQAEGIAGLEDHPLTQL